MAGEATGILLSDIAIFTLVAQWYLISVAKGLESV